MCAAESSSEDENTARLREAVWSVEPGAYSVNKDGEKNGMKSRRVDASKHEEDGNELQTTPEFRSYVAKKLGVMLDSCISEVSCETPDSRRVVCGTGGEEREDEGGDEGFRLFSTSLPGKWWEEPSPAPPPRRPRAPSTSDSDSDLDMRLREAAVSVSDLIPPSTEINEEKGRMNSRVAGEASEEREEPKKKKKKKKKKAPEGTVEDELSSKGKETQNQRTDEEPRAEEDRKKKKKKKKKKIRLDEGK